MATLLENRWKRDGHDRVYLYTPDGMQVGFVDLKTLTVGEVRDGFEADLHECLRRWSSEARPVDEPELSAPPIPVAPGATAPPVDLALNKPGEKARARKEAARDRAPVRSAVGRALGVKTEERSWRLGERGEVKVARTLAGLGPAWRVLHAVAVGKKGSDIDHVVIGPTGVYTVNSKCHPGGKVKVTKEIVYVNGRKTDYLRSSRHEADRAQQLLTRACGFPVAVDPVIVFAELDDFAVKEEPGHGVLVTRRRYIGRALTSMPPRLTGDEIEAIYAAARLSTTWQ